jgi:hypothetical protein
VPQLRRKMVELTWKNCRPNVFLLTIIVKSQRNCEIAPALSTVDIVLLRA